MSERTGVGVRLAGPSHLGYVASLLRTEPLWANESGAPAASAAGRAGTLLDPSAPAWALIAEHGGRQVGCLVGSTVFSTWGAEDFLDVQALWLDVEAEDEESVTAALREHATALGVTTVRWQRLTGQSETVPGAPSDSAPRRLAKVRFTLPVPAVTDERSDQHG